MADVFDNQVNPSWRADLWHLIRRTPDLDWLLLTKRPQNIRKMVPSDWGDGWDNVWLGATTEDQHRFDQRWPILEAVPARMRFVSYEPAIGPLRLPGGSAPVPDWVIVGGESGSIQRPIQPSWVMDIVADCKSRKVAAFFKQWGMYQFNPLTKGLPRLEWKKLDPHGKGGALLNGVLIREFPV